MWFSQYIPPVSMSTVPVGSIKDVELLLVEVTDTVVLDVAAVMGIIHY